jgi:hypothetical protein
MHPFTASEPGESFSFEKALQTGLIPVVPVEMFLWNPGEYLR